MTGTRGRELTHRVGLRYRDVDLFGHINHAAYHDLLDEARANFFISANDGALMAFVVRRVELDYLAELRVEDRYVDVRTAPGRVGDRSITLIHEIVRRDGAVAASGLAVMVAFDAAARSSRSITQDERRRLTA
ncbi:MAG: acyl-CoA thioester hydrolase [Solirubrobacteraceae bacterium]|nr:acyl-CoA thioester hydrolase [Solirubrobacteraceae bacterium]